MGKSITHKITKSIIKKTGEKDTSELLKAKKTSGSIKKLKTKEIDQKKNDVDELK